MLTQGAGDAPAEFAPSPAKSMSNGTEKGGSSSTSRALISRLAG